MRGVAACVAARCTLNAEPAHSGRTSSGDRLSATVRTRRVSEGLAMDSDDAAVGEPTWGSPPPHRGWSKQQTLAAIGVAAVIAAFGGAAIYAATAGNS